jgi:hypothetical protein
MMPLEPTIRRPAPADVMGRTGTRQWVTIFALLAFFLQSLAVQTHFHHPMPQSVGTQTTAGGHMPPAPVRNQEPVDQCRLCQELLHAGIFVTPSTASALASLTLTAVAFTPLPSALASLTTAFAWQSRALPRR